MKSKVRDWHGRNMDAVIDDTANRRDMRYIYAIAIAIKYILEWIERRDHEVDRC